MIFLFDPMQTSLLHFESSHVVIPYFVLYTHILVDSTGLVFWVLIYGSGVRNSGDGSIKSQQQCWCEPDKIPENNH